MQFALICRDNPGVLEKRLAARPEHIEGLKQARADGTLRDAGAMIDTDGNMCGSVVLCEFDNRAGVDDFLEREVYSREGIWGEIEVIEIRCVDWDALMAG